MILEDIQSQLSGLEATVVIVHAEEDQQVTYPVIVLDIEQEKRNYSMDGRSCSGGGEDGGDLVWGWITLECQSRTSLVDAYNMARQAQCILEGPDSQLLDRHTGYYPAIDNSDVQIYVVSDTYRMAYYEACEP